MGINIDDAYILRSCEDLEMLSSELDGEYTLGIHGFDSSSFWIRNGDEWNLNVAAIEDKKKAILWGNIGEKPGLKVASECGILSTVRFDELEPYISTEGYYDAGGVIVALPKLLRSESGETCFIGGPNEERIQGDRNFAITSYSEIALLDEDYLDSKFILGTYSREIDVDGNLCIRLRFNPNHIAFTGGYVPDEEFYHMIGKLKNMRIPDDINAEMQRQAVEYESSMGASVTKK